MAERAAIPQRLLYSVREAAALLCISTKTLERRMLAGDIRYLQDGQGKRRKFYIKDIERYQDERELHTLAQAGIPEDTPYSIGALTKAPFEIRPTLMLRRARTGARVREKKFGINERIIKELVRRAAGRCEVSGLPFSSMEVNSVKPFAPSLDRIDSTKGYLPENCRLVCYAVNVALHQWGDEVLLRIAEGIVRKAHGR